jgi:glycosyltransferase involved in cell wall biosynthesis
MVPKKEVMELYSHASVFCCPSIYEPFGIINLEAMACHAPVVASAVGGIKEVVIPENTGLLVPLQQMNKSPFEPKKPKVFSRDLALAINRVLADESLRRKFIKNGRKRAEEHFSWKSIAKQTLELYKSLQS